MRLLALMAALSLTACASKPPPVIPDALLKPVTVKCADGATMRALGSCALRYRSGLAQANDQISSIAKIARAK